MVKQARHHSSSSLERYSRCFLGHGHGTLHIATLDPETGIVTFDPEKESPA